MAYEEVMLEVMNATTTAVSDGVRDGVRKWGEDPVKDLIKSLFLGGLTLGCASSAAGSFALVLGKLLISRWRAMAAKVPDQKIVDGIRYAELVLNDYGDLLDNGKSNAIYINEPYLLLRGDLDFCVTNKWGLFSNLYLSLPLWSS